MLQKWDEVSWLTTEPCWWMYGQELDTTASSVLDSSAYISGIRKFDEVSRGPPVAPTWAVLFTFLFGFSFV